MLKRKFATMQSLLREGGMAGLWSYLLRNVREKTVTLDGCTFGSRGIHHEVLRNDLLDGIFEKFERGAVQQFVSTRLPVVELGGCLGVIGCITNRLLENPEAHVVVEANPRVIPLMKANRRRNRSRFAILNRAIAYGSTSIEYAPSDNFAGNSLHTVNGGQKVRVKATALGEILAEHKFSRFTLICDIEGHECELVEREADALRNADVIILETHARLVGEARNQAMLEQLARLGFEVVSRDSYVVVLKNTAIADAA